jgi:hypothetical protein
MILLIVASSVSKAKPRCKANMYFVNKVVTKGQFHIALA